MCEPALMSFSREGSYQRQVSLGESQLCNGIFVRLVKMSFLHVLYLASASFCQDTAGSFLHLMQLCRYKGKRKHLFEDRIKNKNLISWTCVNLMVKILKTVYFIKKHGWMVLIKVNWLQKTRHGCYEIRAAFSFSKQTIYDKIILSGKYWWSC